MARPPTMQQHNGDATSSMASPTAGPSTSTLATVLLDSHQVVLDAWTSDLLASDAFRSGRASADAVRSEGSSILTALGRATASGNITDVGAPEYGDLRQLLETMSVERARQGYLPAETASAIFSLKDALAPALRDALADEPVRLVTEIATMNRLIDRLGLITFDAYVAGREEVIASQQASMLELSTPVVKLWDGIVAVPLIGTLDSGRTQLVMESLLQAIVETESQVAIIDITGVSMVDTLVAQHLLKTVEATRLMGADCIISGIRPQIAQTMVHLGVELGEVITKATLADAFRVALERIAADPVSSTLGS